MWYAKKGGRLVVTGDSGRYDEWNAQRLENPLLPQLAGLPNVVLRTEPDMLPSAKLGWSYRLSPPKDGGRALMSDIAKTGYAPPVGIVGAPQHVFAEFKRLDKGFALFLLNYNPDVKVKGVSLKASAGRRVRFTPILEGDFVPSALAPSSEGVFPLPSFTRGAIVEIEIAAKSVTEEKGDSVVIFKKGDVAKK